MASSLWKDVILFLLVASVRCQILTEKDITPSPVISTESTGPKTVTYSPKTTKLQSLFSVALPVMDRTSSTKSSTNAAEHFIETVFTKWTSLLVHGFVHNIPTLPDDKRQGRQYTKIRMQNSSSGCHLHSLPTKNNVSFHNTVLDLVNSGKRLIKFTIQFPEYESNPLKVNMPSYYKPYVWVRTYDTHAYTLLALPFNYKILSMGTLWFGTKELDAEVIDCPKGCFPKLSIEDKLYVTMDLISKDFKQGHQPTEKMYGQDSHVCHQIIKVEDGFGHFSYRCCRRPKEGFELECSPYQDSKWLNALFVILVIVDILAFLFGPQCVNYMILAEELDLKPYGVHLDPPINGTMHNGRQFNLIITTDNSNGETDQGDAINITKLLLAVDHRTLMSSRYVPIGFFQFIYENVFQCGMRRSEPFKSCFQSPMCWWGKKPNFKNRYIQAFAELVLTPKWKVFMKSLGKLIMLVCLPIPLYIRLAIYYKFESDEIDARQQAMGNQGVTLTKQYGLFQHLTPAHLFYQIVYGLMIGSICSLFILRYINKTEFNEIIVDAFKDLHNIRRFETFRLFCTHILLPFKTCGIFGILFAPFYWIGMILVSIIVIIIYTIPTVYLTFRFLILDRQSIMALLHGRKFRWCTNSEAHDHEMTLEQHLLLHRISPDDTIHSKNNIDKIINGNGDSTYQVLMSDINRKTKVKAANVGKLLFRIAVGLFCIMFMLCSLLLFSEVVGFFVEVAIFTFMGVIVNADSAGKFITVALMSVLYCVSIFRGLHNAYAKLNKSIFELLTDKLHKDISAITEKPANQQQDVAFRYLNDKDINDLGGEAVTHTFKRDQDHLLWNCKGLVLFVDAKDTPRIPRKFFYQACEITVSGCPGPVAISLFKAIRQIFFMVLFLVFVLWVVILFHNVYTLTTTQQLLFTLSGSFLPFLIKFFMDMKESKDDDFNNYAFKGSVNEILIGQYEQNWPVCGFEYKLKSDHSSSNDQTGKGVSTCDKGMQTESELEVVSPRPSENDYVLKIPWKKETQQPDSHTLIKLNISQYKSPSEGFERFAFETSVIGINKMGIQSQSGRLAVGE